MNLLDSESNIICGRIGYNFNVFWAADDKRRVVLWRIHKQNPKMILTGSPSNINCISFGLKHQNIYTGSECGNIYVWDLTNCKLSNELSGHTDQWNFIELASDEEGKLMISGSEDATIWIWDLRSYKNVRTLQVHSKSVNWAKFSPDGNWVASGGSDGNTYITDIRTNNVVNWFEEPEEVVTSIDFNPKTYTLTTGWYGKWIKYYDLESFSEINTIKFNTSAIKHIEFYNKDEFEYVEYGFFGSDDSVRLINWEQNKQACVYNISHETLWDMKIDYSHNLLTWLCSNQSELYFKSIELPEIDLNIEENVKHPNSLIEEVNFSDNNIHYNDIISEVTDKILEKGEIVHESPASVTQFTINEYSINTIDDKIPVQTKSDEASNFLNETEILNQTTFKLAPENIPANIDFDEFSSKSNAKELKDIDEVLEKHFHFLDSLKQRQQKLKNIIVLYSPYKNISMTISALEQMNDIGVTNDLWSALFSEGTFMNQMSMKQWLSIFPYLDKLVNSKHESHFITGAMGVYNMVSYFGQEIIKIRNSSGLENKDLEKKEQLETWDSLLNIFLNFFKGKTLKKRTKLKNNWGEIAWKLFNELHDFLALSEDSKGNSGARILEEA